MHEILIDNIKNHDVFTYPIVILKGSIQNNEEHHRCTCSGLIKISVNNNFTCTPKVKDECFVSLIELKLGENTVFIRSCTTSLMYTLKYTAQNMFNVVQPLYIICDGHNGHFQAPKSEHSDPESACKRINTGAKLLQCILAEKLFEQNLGRKTFEVKHCKLFYSKLYYKEARKMNQHELWDYFAREIMTSNIASENKKYWAFLSCTKYRGSDYDKSMVNYEDILQLTEGHATLGGGGLALLGTACLYTWPEDINQVISRFKSDELIDRNKFMDDSYYRGTRGHCFSTTLGSALHELCHTFGLGHTQNGIMGRGFHNISDFFLLEPTKDWKSYKKCSYKSLVYKSDSAYWTSSSLVFLSYHRWLNGPMTSAKHKLAYNHERRFLTSTAGIKVVEIRDVSKEMVLWSWVFPGRILKFSFGIPSDILENCDMKHFVLVVEDSVGNIIKENISVIL